MSNKELLLEERAAENILKLVNDNSREFLPEEVEKMIQGGQVLKKRAEILIKNSQEDKHYGTDDTA